MLDLLGVLHNAAYLLLFERARTDFWRMLGAGYGAEGFDWPYLVARNEINYRAPIRNDQAVRVTVAIEGIGRTSVTFAHSILTDDGMLSADGKTVIVRVDSETGRPVEWSEAFRAMIAPYTLPAEEASRRA
jgi:acyl-CoA thioester hydrolase